MSLWSLELPYLLCRTQSPTSCFSLQSLSFVFLAYDAIFLLAGATEVETEKYVENSTEVLVAITDRQNLMRNNQ